MQALEHYDLYATNTCNSADPTPYDQCQAFGLITLTPALGSTGISPITAYDPTQCGSWSVETVSMYTGFTTLSLGLNALSVSNLGSAVPTKSMLIPPLPNYQEYLDSDNPFIGNFTGCLNSDANLYVDGAGDIFADPRLSAGICGLPARVKTYLSPQSSSLPDGQWDMDVPSGLLPWLAQQSDVRSMYPYITDCYSLSGIGQPIVLVLVTQMAGVSSISSMRVRLRLCRPVLLRPKQV
jgi:hypothetical protein